MGILLGAETRLMVQGITGHQGTFHTRAMLDYGTKVVAGVTPGKGGTVVHGVPVYDSCEEAVATETPNASILFVPAIYAKDAAAEVIEAGVRLLVIITDHIPFHDSLDLMHYAHLRGASIVGPNCPGLCTPGAAKAGIMPNHIFLPGPYGVVSRSGTLTYEIVNMMTRAGLGQSTCIGIGGDPIVGTSMVEALALFAKDPATRGVVVVGEIGGTAEEETAALAKTMDKPVWAYVAGRTAPPGKRMGHAGAIIAQGMGTAESKVRAFTEAGIPVAKYPREIPELIKA